MNSLSNVFEIVAPYIGADLHPFEETVSVVGPVVAGIIILFLFVKLMAWLGSRSPTRVAFKGVLDPGRKCTVHLANGTSFENVRLVGFTDSSSVKGAFPYELHNLLILEHDDGRRSLIPAKYVRMIDVPPTATAGPPFGSR